MLQISRVRLQDVRCFHDLRIDFGKPGSPAGWTLVVGDNATGKSTLLRSIAMGLCDEASAAGLLKESDEGYIRRGATRARISIWLYDPRSPDDELRITTQVIREKKQRRGIFTDRVRQTTKPTGAAFPWDELFVSGYGAGRGVTGTGDISSYSAIDAVYNMFNYTEGLQNPELVIRRLMTRDANLPVEQRQVFQVMSEASGTKNIRLTTNGIRVDGPGFEGMPLRDLADGYKSAVLWITDLIGWALSFQPRLKSTEGIGGIVVIDELEQHLHARWQRTVVDDLRRLFPKIQFIAATHSPLIASSVGPRLDGTDADNLYVLEARTGGRVEASRHEPMRGWRMDQVLASRAFKYQIHAEPEIQRVLKEGSKLAAKRNRTKREESAYQALKMVFKDRFFTSTSPIEREAELEAKRELRDEIKQLERRVLGKQGDDTD